MRAQAGGWQHELDIPVRMRVSLFKTAVQTLRQPLLWMAAAGVYGGVLGWLLGRVGQAFREEVAGSAGMAAVSALFGALIYAAMAGLLAAFHLFDGSPGAGAARSGIAAGAVAGLGAGALAGLLLFRAWLALSPGHPGMDLALFGGFSGLLSGAALGLGLYFLLKPST